MRKALCILLFLPLALAHAQTGFMHVKAKDGTTRTFALNDITRIHITFGTGVDGLATGGTGVIRSFALLQNYPNPFNPGTTIQYSVPRAGDVDIAIFDVGGRLVRHSSVAEQSPGTHAFQWDGRNQNGAPVSSGIYLYSVRFGKSILSRKMMLIK
jgi:hypothetical protein